MLLKDIYDTSNCFISNILKTDFAELYAVIFNDTDASTLDSYVIYNYGQKTVCWDSIDTCNSMIRATIELNKDTWKRLFTTLSLEYDADSNTTTTTVSEATTSEKTGNSNNVNSVVTYDATTFKDNEKNTSTDSDNSKGTRTNTTTVKANVNAVDNVTKEVQLRQRAYRRDVINTIVDAITISIYDV